MLRLFAPLCWIGLWLGSILPLTPTSAHAAAGVTTTLLNMHTAIPLELRQTQVALTGAVWFQPASFAPGLPAAQSSIWGGNFSVQWSFAPVNGLELGFNLQGSAERLRKPWPAKLDPVALSAKWTFLRQGDALFVAVQGGVEVPSFDRAWTGDLGLTVSWKPHPQVLLEANVMGLTEWQFQFWRTRLGLRYEAGIGVWPIADRLMFFVEWINDIAWDIADPVGQTSTSTTPSEIRGMLSVGVNYFPDSVFTFTLCTVFDLWVVGRPTEYQVMMSGGWVFPALY